MPELYLFLFGFINEYLFDLWAQHFRLLPGLGVGARVRCAWETTMVRGNDVPVGGVLILLQRREWRLFRLIDYLDGILMLVHLQGWRYPLDLEAGGRVIIILAEVRRVVL